MRLPLATLALLLAVATPAGAAARSKVVVPPDTTARGLALELRAARCGPAPRATIALGGRTVARRPIARRWRVRRVVVALVSGQHDLTVRAPACRRVRVRRARVVGLRPAPRSPEAPPLPPPPPAPLPPALTELAAEIAADPVDGPHQVPLGSAVSWERVDDDDALRALFAAEFDSLTPENEMKMAYLQPRRGEFDFEASDKLVRFARILGKRVRGHTLVWHQQNPGWLTHGAWSAEELEDVLVEHVTTVVGRYRGRVEAWDVVNEPLEADGSLRAGRAPWAGVLGRGYIETALRAARAADPGAKLFINEVGAEHVGPKLDALVALAADLKARGVPLDGIGLQNHTTTVGFPDRDRLAGTIARFAELGLEVEITEMDVAVAGDTGTAEERLARQATAYGAAADACGASPACTGITVWGLADHLSWLGEQEGALPFDAALAPKPAWHALGG